MSMNLKIARRLIEGDVVRTHVAWREVMGVYADVETLVAERMPESDVALGITGRTGVLAGADDGALTVATTRRPDNTYGSPLAALDPRAYPQEWDELDPAAGETRGPGTRTLSFVHLVGNRLATGNYVAVEVLTPERGTAGAEESAWLLLDGVHVVETIAGGAR